MVGYFPLNYPAKIALSVDLEMRVASQQQCYTVEVVACYYINILNRVNTVFYIVDRA